MPKIATLSEDWVRVLNWLEVFDRDRTYFACASCGDSIDTCARGIVFALGAQHIVSCIMEPDHRIIVHTLIPVTNDCRTYSQLFTLDMFTALRAVLKKKGVELSMELTGERCEIRFPGPYKKELSYPMEWIGGHMFTPARDAFPGEQMSVDAADFASALETIRLSTRSGHDRPTVFVLSASPDGSALWSHSSIFATHQILATATPVDTEAQFCLMQENLVRLSKIVQHMARYQRGLSIRVGTSALVLSNERDCVHIFSDVPADLVPRLWVPLRARRTDHTSLRLAHDSFGVQKDKATAVRRLLTTRKTDAFRVPTIRWLLRQDQVEIIVRNSRAVLPVIADCTCNTWGSRNEIIGVEIERAATAAIMRGLASIRGSFSLSCGKNQLTIQALESGFEMMTRIIRTVSEAKLRDDATANDCGSQVQECTTQR